MLRLLVILRKLEYHSHLARRWQATQAKTSLSDDTMPKKRFRCGREQLQHNTPQGALLPAAYLATTTHRLTFACCLFGWLTGAIASTCEGAICSLLQPESERKTGGWRENLPIMYRVVRSNSSQHNWHANLNAIAKNKTAVIPFQADRNIQAEQL